MYRYLLVGLLAFYGDLCMAQDWYSEGRALVEKNRMLSPNKARAKNIILFIGDGMGVSTVTAARILGGQLEGHTGEENILAWEHFPNVALSKTYNTNQQVADSAGTATAFMTGVKSNAGVINVHSSVSRGDCLASKGRDLTSFLELAEVAGMSTGVVTTARLTHATPAAAYAHSPERNWEQDGDIPDTEKQSGCADIARQFIEFSEGDGIEVAFGGGRRDFFSNRLRGPEGKKGRRSDGRNLIGEWEKKHKAGTYVWNKTGFDKIKPKKTGPVLGLFNSSHMNFEADRARDKGGEPSLAEMTEKAVEILQNKGKGYFLYVEGARIDHGHHGGNAYRALHDTLAFADAVKKAHAMTNDKDTLIIVTADHSHTLTIGGYPSRGNDILGKVFENDASGKKKTTPALGTDNLPFTTLGYYSGPGARVDKKRKDIFRTDTTDKNFRQPALVPTGIETHAGEDVAIYADGPGAYLLRGVVEQNYIFHVMFHAARMEFRLKK